MNYDELEQMIKNDCTYEELIEESKRIDEYIKKQIKEAIQASLLISKFTKICDIKTKSGKSREK